MSPPPADRRAQQPPTQRPPAQQPAKPGAPPVGTPQPAPQQAQQPAKPAPEIVEPADATKMLALTEAYMEKRDQAETAERRRNIAFVNFYKAEGEIQRFDEELRAKYNMGQYDQVDPETGRLIRRGPRPGEQQPHQHTH